jgi:hypothetical protein
MSARGRIMKQHNPPSQLSSHQLQRLHHPMPSISTGYIADDSESDDDVDPGGKHSHSVNLEFSFILYLPFRLNLKVKAHPPSVIPQGG